MSRPKSKTQKKIDGQIVRALTAVCEQSREDVTGFEWLTHQVDFTNFPASLLVTCVFQGEAERESAEQGGVLRPRIQRALLGIGVRLKSAPQQIRFDSEAACFDQADGDWSRRLAAFAQWAVAKNRPQ